MLVKLIKSLMGVAVVAGSCILPMPSQAAQCGYASHYGVGDGYGGQRTASGERMNPYALTAAHRYLPLGSRLKVTYGDRTITVRINDRGPYSGDRILDLSYGAFQALAHPGKGEIHVCVAQV